MTVKSRDNPNHKQEAKAERGQTATASSSDTFPSGQSLEGAFHSWQEASLSLSLSFKTGMPSQAFTCAVQTAYKALPMSLMQPLVIFPKLLLLYPPRHLPLSLHS